MRVLHREARRIAKDVTDLDGVTGGCIATVYQFADGSVAYFALDAPAWREADEIAGRALLAIKPLTPKRLANKQVLDVPRHARGRNYYRAPPF